MAYVDGHKVWEGQPDGPRPDVGPTARRYRAFIPAAHAGTDVAEWERSGRATAEHLVAQLGIGAGADVSTRMLGHARLALASHGNTALVALNGFDLHGIANASLDVVYGTAVFMHLDEWGRYRYV